MLVVSCGFDQFSGAEMEKEYHLAIRYSTLASERQMRGPKMTSHLTVNESSICDGFIVRRICDAVDVLLVDEYLGQLYLFYNSRAL